MTSWTPVENALHAFAVAALGLDPSRITWSEQNGPAPAADGQLALTVALSDDNLKSIDQRTASVNGGAEELELEYIATRTKIVTWRAYSPAATGDTQARALLEAMQLKTAFEEPRDALNAAGIGLLNEGDVQALPRVVNAGWESQAILEWRICLLQTASETIPYIAHVNGEGEVAEPGGVPLVVPIDVDLS